jgi:hypothetical protein
LALADSWGKPRQQPVEGGTLACGGRFASQERTGCTVGFHQEGEIAVIHTSERPIS